MIRKLFLSSAVLLSGCANYVWDDTEVRSIYAEDSTRKTNTFGTLMTWESDVSAALIDEKGNSCVQSALTARNYSSTFEASVSDALLNLSKTAQAAAADGDTGELASIASSINSTAMALRTSTERTAALNVGLFYICQLAMNEFIGKADVKDVTKDLILKVTGMTPSQTQVVQADLFMSTFRDVVKKAAANDGKDGDGKGKDGDGKGKGKGKDGDGKGKDGDGKGKDGDGAAGNG